MPLPIHISRESEVPIRVQVSTQIVLRLGVGEIKPGEALPSVRALARQLGIHRNTVSEAYRDKVLEMLVIHKPGSRLVVRDHADRPVASVGDLDGVVDLAIQVARRHGYSQQQLVERLRQRILATPPDRLLVISDDKGMRTIMTAELKQQFALPITACSVSEVSADRDLLVGALALSPPGHLPTIHKLSRHGQRAVPVLYASVGDYLDLIRQLKKASLIAVVSVSDYFHETARGIFAPVIGNQHALRQVRPTENELESIATADLVFCDFAAYPLVRKRRLKAPVLCHRLISPACFDRIAQALSVDGLSPPVEPAVALGASETSRDDAVEADA